MENENDHVEVENNDEDLDLDLEADEEEESEEKPEIKKAENPKETSEQRVARLKRQLAREEKKLGLNKTEKKESETKEKATKSSELGYAEKAYLIANGIKGADEVSLVEEFLANTGKELDSVVESKFFQSELKELREARASADAVPKGSKRSGSSSKDSVDYWLAKGELPENTPDNQELRRKVVNARYERESRTNKFSTNPSGRIVKQSQQK